MKKAKIQWKKFEQLPEYKVITIWYDNKGKILTEISKTDENYFISDIIKSGKAEGMNYVEYMCEKRDKPKSAGII